MIFKEKRKRSLARHAREIIWPSIGWRRAGRYLMLRVQRMQGTPHSIAAGIASGAAVSFTPFMGFHVITGMMIAVLTRGSPMAAVFGTLVGNPWTFPLIWISSYKLGVSVLDMPGHEGLPRDLSLSYIFDHPGEILMPLTLGGTLMGFVAWIITYYLARDLIVYYRKRRQKILMKKRKHRHGKASS